MRALVGQFAPGSLGYRARTVELEGQPSWTLAQLRVIWARTFGRDTAEFVEALLHRDWSVLACTPWPETAVAERRPDWAYVCGMGRAARPEVSGGAVVGRMGEDAPDDGDGWAYLWEHGLGAMHVYAAQAGRWHHLATLPADVWSGLTEQLVVDVESRLCWLEREEAAA
ncbi:hypothetical protein DDE19_26000 [Micromonospora ureilytica]|uniref:Uncharacterized protein n=1 Tax=Micromonospora ureilytica TaxID=709868 RepID=A0A3N9XJY4_9ACTN|nr:hypothetical protein [Micromonospora ureilytica]RQX13395.1 hypothetical protein DDE19_26000 [Micromonospora ureilytica]